MEEKFYRVRVKPYKKKDKLDKEKNEIDKEEAIVATCSRTTEQ